MFNQFLADALACWETYFMALDFQNSVVRVFFITELSSVEGGQENLRNIIDISVLLVMV